MKCIQCGTDNTLQDRTSNYGRCKSCRHQFVFEPTSMKTVKVTDPMFAKAIADLSANNALFFTRKQFLYLLDSRLKKKAIPIDSVAGLVFIAVFLNFWAGLFFGGIITAISQGSIKPGFWISIIVNVFFIVSFYRMSQSVKLGDRERQKAAKALQILGILILFLGGSAGLFLVKSFPIFAVFVVLGMAAIYLGRRQRIKSATIPQTFLLKESELQSWLVKWQPVNGTIEKMLSPPREDQAPASINPDVTAYSFDRLVVCDSAVVAQLLIANNFHFENNCAILSITGYPQSIFNTTMEMLRRNPDLKVYALHDCTPKGIGLANHLRNPQWFPDSQIAIVDVGLVPRQILADSKMWVQTSTSSAAAAQEISAEVRQSLTADEITWLETGNYVELESFTPQRLIHVLNRGIAGSQDLSSSSDGIIFFGDSGGYYATDSFG